MLEIGKVKDKRAPILRGKQTVAVLTASNWKDEAALSSGETVWNLRSAKGKRGTHRIERSGQKVALSGRTGTWSTRATLDAADDVPLDHQLFLLWMLLVLNRRADNTAAATAIAGGTAAAGSS